MTQTLIQETRPLVDIPSQAEVAACDPFKVTLELQKHQGVCRLLCPLD